MPYEIPKSLKYEEKIIFGLSLPQFFWLGLFGSMAAMVFLKTPLPFEAKAVVSVALLFFGASFAFFGLHQHIRSFLNYRKGVKKAGYTDSRLDSFVEVKKIENDCLYLNNNSLRGVIEVTPINFKILGEQEQRAIISAYLGFLNSLDFPIQIVMRTTNLNIDDYLMDLKKGVVELNNPEVENQFDSFKEFILNFIKENSVKNRLFYVVVPYAPTASQNPVKDFFVFAKNLVSREKEKTTSELNKEIALNQLDIRVKLCMAKLKNCGLFVKRLEDNQLTALLASFFDSYIHAGNDYFSPVTMLSKHEEGT